MEGVKLTWKAVGQKGGKESMEPQSVREACLAERQQEEKVAFS